MFYPYRPGIHWQEKARDFSPGNKGEPGENGEQEFIFGPEIIDGYPINRILMVSEF
jgi:hypothetical protein